MEGIALLTGATGVLASLGCLEAYWHRRHRCGIPLRIHVNGTRGKSSVTRLIAAGLRSAGIRTCAKTTGTLPRFIRPDGTEDAIERVGRTNVIEQVHIIRRAADLGAEAVVLECMALHPLLQSLCELDIVRATHGVITNARPDHLDVMGPTPADVARSLAGTVPVKGIFFTAERDPSQLRILEDVAKDRDSQFQAVDDAEINRVTPGELQGFSYIEHPDNVALSLSVCQSLGIDRHDRASRHVAGGSRSRRDVAMDRRATQPADGLRQCLRGERPAIDRPHLASGQLDEHPGRHADRRRQLPQRPPRTLGADGRDVCPLDQPGHTCSPSAPGRKFSSNGPWRAGFPPCGLHAAERQPAETLFNQLRDVSGRLGLIMGLGNIAGVGMELVDLFRSRSQNFIHTIHPRKEAA